MRTSSVVCTSVWLAEMTCCPSGSVAGSRRGPVSRWWAASSSSTGPATLHPGADQHDQVVADPFQVRDQVRGQHHADSSCSATASIRSCRNSRRASGSRLATGSSRISSSGRLAMARVSASWARCPPDSVPGPLVRVQVQPLDPAAGQFRVPARVEARAQPQVIADRQPGVDRRVLGQEPDPGQLRRAGRGRAAEHLDRARGRRQQADGQVQQSRLARPRSGRPGPPRARPGCSACSRPAPTRRYRLPSPWVCRTELMLTLCPPQLRTERC